MVKGEVRQGEAQLKERLGLVVRVSRKVGPQGTCARPPKSYSLANFPLCLLFFKVYLLLLLLLLLLFFPVPSQTHAHRSSRYGYHPCKRRGVSVYFHKILLPKPPSTNKLFSHFLWRCFHSTIPDAFHRLYIPQERVERNAIQCGE